MANKTTILRAPNGDPVPMVLVDNGDGTYSLGTSALSSTPGTAAASLGKAEDNPHTSGDVGVMLLAVRTDTAAARAGTDGDYAPLEVDASGRLWVSSVSQPSTSGGLSAYRSLDLGSTGVAVKTSAGQLYGYYLYNNSSSATRFVKIYDKASAASSSDTPVMTLPIPAGSAANVSFGAGIAFASGISVRATTAIADNDTGAPSTNDVVVNLLYK